MRTYRKTFKCSEVFPAEIDEEWQVRERGRVVERWRVVSRGRTNFTAEIIEFVKPDHS